MIKIAPEGYPTIRITFFVSILFLIILTLLIRISNFATFIFYLEGATFFSIIFTLFSIYFFRDPERNIPSKEGIFVSPADGKVILIRDVYDNKYLNEYVKEISIFMSPLDVHVNRSPCDGIVEYIEHNKGKYIAAYKNEASVENENIVMIINGLHGKILVRQVAGFIARRVVCRVKPGEYLKIGSRYGIIKFGSRVDVYLPKNTKIIVNIGDKVKAGETIIGEKV